MKKIIGLFMSLGIVFLFSVTNYADVEKSSNSDSENEGKVNVVLTNEEVEYKISPEQVLVLDKTYLDDIVSVEADEAELGVQFRAAFGAASYGKTITITSSSPSFSKTYYYREYNNNAKRWYAGRLNFVKSVKSGNKYIATYGGVIVIQA